MSDNKKIWSFNESFLWQNEHPECGNSKQSPINIKKKIYPKRYTKKRYSKKRLFSRTSEL